MSKNLKIIIAVVVICAMVLGATLSGIFWYNHGKNDAFLDVDLDTWSIEVDFVNGLIWVIPGNDKYYGFQFGECTFINENSFGDGGEWQT